MFFDSLYDEDVISEDAFYKWETSKDPAEQQGKGVALKSVTAFFTWLREAEEESEDNWQKGKKGHVRGRVLKQTIVAETITASSKMKYKQTLCISGKNGAHQCKWYSSLT